MNKNTMTNEQETNSVDYLRQQAEEAHRNGDLGKVRHMIFLAIERCERTDIDFLDIGWAFILGIYWAVSGQDFEILFQTFETHLKKHCSNFSRLGNMDKYYKELIDALKDSPDTKRFRHIAFIIYLTKVFKPDWKNIDGWIDLLFSIPLQDPDDSLDFCTQIILPFIIETCWFLQQNNKKWDRLCDKWTEQLNKSRLHRKISNEIQLIKEKIRVFQWLFHKEQVDSGEPRNTSLMEKQIWNELYEAFRFYLDNDDLACYEKLDSLSRKTGYDDEHFLLVQGFRNVVHLQIMFRLQIELKQRETELEKEVKQLQDLDRKTSFRNQSQLIEKKKKNKEQIEDKLRNWTRSRSGGILRYQRSMMENKYKQFKKQREAVFQEYFHCATIKPDDSSSRINCLRFVILMELSDIRDFDFWGYRNSLEKEKDFSLHVGMYDNESVLGNMEADFLAKSIILSIKSISPIDDNVLKKAENRLELAECGKEKILEIAKQCLTTWPCQHNVALRILRIISDAIPDKKEFLKELALWTKQYKEYNRRSGGFDLSYLNIWEKIVENISLDDSIWTDIYDDFRMYFISNRHLSLETDLLQTVLLKAPTMRSENWIECIKREIESGHPINENVLRFIYNACDSNKSLIISAQKVFKAYERKYPEKNRFHIEMKMLESKLDLDTFTSENQKIMSELTGRMIMKLSSFSDKIHNAFLKRKALKTKSREIGIGGNLFSDYLSALGWKNINDDQEKSIVSSLSKAFRSDPDAEQARQLFSLIRDLVLYGNDSIRPGIFRILKSFWLEPPNFININDPSDNSAFSSFRFSTNIPNTTIYYLLVLGAVSYRYSKGSIRDVIRNFSIRYGLECDSYAPHVAAIYLYGILLGLNENEKLISKNLFLSTINITRGNLELQSNIAGTLFYLLSNELYPIKFTGLELLKKTTHINSFLNCIFLWFLDVYWSPYPEFRKNIALLAKLFLDNGFKDKKLYEISNKMKDDVRARVRNVFKEIDIMENINQGK